MQSRIRAVRRVVKQIPTEMLQQCSSVSSCMWTCVIMEKHYTGCQRSCFHSEWPYKVFNIFQYTYKITVFTCCLNSTISTPFLSQKTVAISFLADVCLNIFGLFGECVCIHCFDCCLVASFTKGHKVRICYENKQ
jgi:hypothetical protein